MFQKKFCDKTNEMRSSGEFEGSLRIDHPPPWRFSSYLSIYVLATDVLFVLLYRLMTPVVNCYDFLYIIIMALQIIVVKLI